MNTLIIIWSMFICSFIILFPDCFHSNANLNLLFEYDGGIKELRKSHSPQESLSMNELVFKYAFKFVSFLKIPSLFNQ